MTTVHVFGRGIRFDDSVGMRFLFQQFPCYVCQEHIGYGAGASVRVLIPHLSYEDEIRHFHNGCLLCMEAICFLEGVRIVEVTTPYE